LRSEASSTSADDHESPTAVLWALPHLFNFRERHSLLDQLPGHAGGAEDEPFFALCWFRARLSESRADTPGFGSAAAVESYL
jgi:hypothetical protein